MNDLFLLFDNYITGELSPEEILEFETKLEQDVSFKEDFLAYKETHQFLQHKFNNETELSQFINTTEKIASDYFNTQQKKKNNYWFIGVAASILLLIGIFIFNPSTPTYEEYMTYPTVELTVRGTQEEILKNAQNAFNSKDFTKANELFSTALQQDQNNIQIALYKGISLLELNQLNEADKILTNIYQGNSSFTTDANWYLALSKLKQKEYKSCKELLQKIPEGYIHYKKAQKLINKLPNK